MKKRNGPRNPLLDASSTTAPLSAFGEARRCRRVRSFATAAGLLRVRKSRPISSARRREGIGSTDIGAEIGREPTCDHAARLHTPARRAGPNRRRLHRLIRSLAAKRQSRRGDPEVPSWGRLGPHTTERSPLAANFPFSGSRIMPGNRNP
ncbi:putative nucleoside-diphosphate sugar epimerase [Methylobacterium sp. ME121]|jgi:hypothetical protein|nr:putative nucleoside-diphosphate sugar epimerase [Methylobacterium sp. ME121]